MQQYYSIRYLHSPKLLFNCSSYVTAPTATSETSTPIIIASCWQYLYYYSKLFTTILVSLYRNLTFRTGVANFLLSWLIKIIEYYWRWCFYTILNKQNQVICFHINMKIVIICCLIFFLMEIMVSVLIII